MNSTTESIHQEKKQNADESGLTIIGESFNNIHRASLVMPQVKQHEQYTAVYGSFTILERTIFCRITIPKITSKHGENADSCID